MADKCELCGDKAHSEPDTRKDQFGLICPGSAASQEERDTYIQALGEGYLTLLTEVEHYKDTIEDRKRLWYQRERSEVSQDELQADCDVQVAKLHYQRSPEQSDAVLVTPDLDLYPPHLTVQGRVSARPNLIKVHEKDRTEPEDAALFVDPVEPSPVINEPPYGPDFHPLDGYWHK